jgi:hypothetical protein
LTKRIENKCNPVKKVPLFKRNPKLKNFKEVVDIFEHIASTNLLKRLSNPTAVFDQLKQVKEKSKNPQP